MNIFTFTKLLRTFLLAAAVGAAFTSGAFAQGAAVDSASVPFVVNVDATVKATDGAATKQISVTANQEAVLRLPLLKTDGILYFGTQRQANAKAVVVSRGGKAAVNLSAQSYKSAEVSLYTVSGKRVLRKNVSASNTANNISRRNIAPGAYLLSVRGADGSALTSRFTHGGGGLAIDVAFGGKELRASKRLAKEAAAGDWTITVSAEGYVDSVYALRPVEGENPTQNITLREESGGGGDSYDYVEIGGLKWMKKNLDVVTDSSWCYEDSPDSCAKYGRLYKWDEAKTVCPIGWHLPSFEEWDTTLVTMANDFDGYYYDMGGKKVKSTSGWNSYTNYRGETISGNGTDDYGFSALPGGRRDYGSYYDVGNTGYWWTAEVGGSASHPVSVSITNYDEVRIGNDKGVPWNNGLSVRCVKDD